MTIKPNPVMAAADSPPENVNALVWRAMVGATTSSQIAAGRRNEIRGAFGHDVLEDLPAVWDALWHAASGQVPAISCRAPGLVGALLEDIRHSLIELVRAAEQPVDAREIVRVLDAIDRVHAAVSASALRDSGGEPMAEMELLTQVAHDLRSPLTSILFLTDALLRGESGRVEPAQAQQLSLIYSAAFQLSALANDLTALAHNDADLLESFPTRFALDGLLTSVRDIVRPVAEEKNLDLTFSCVAETERVGHPAALGRVLLNLVTNALKYTEEGFVSVEAQPLSVTAVRFAVRDTGPGLSADVLEATKQPGVAGINTPPRGFSASGLGLVICQRLVRIMGGALEVSAPPGGGALVSFAVELPLASDG